MSEPDARRPRLADPPGPPQDWTRLIGEGQAFDALRDHLSDDRAQCVEWCPLCRAADLLRATATPELREQWSSLQRELLLTLRALIDSYLEQTGERERGTGPSVEDIPIE